MPIYEYEADGEGCPSCRERFDVIQRLGEPPLTVCPACGGPIRKLVSRVSVAKDTLGASNLKDKGFHKLVRKDKGVYEKVT